MQLKGYLAEMVHLLVNYPLEVAKTAAERAMVASPNFPPPVPLVQNHGDELLETSHTPLTWAENWDWRAQQQLAERDRREAEAEPLEHRRKVAQRIKGELRTHGFSFEPDP